MNSNHFSREITVFHGRLAPEKGILVGYGAIIDALKLPLPYPARLSLISEKRKRYNNAEWQVFTPRHEPQDTLYGHLVFALKYEGVNLLFFKKLFTLVGSQTIEDLVKNEPSGLYSRKIWFLYEWLLQTSLEIPDLKDGNYVSLLDEEMQFPNPSRLNSQRHRIRNNLPGTINFCPLIFKSPKLIDFIDNDLSEKTNLVFRGVHKDLLLRTSAFLLLKDSKASFSIEGENPPLTRAMRWGRAIGMAGSKPLSKEELIRLQQIVIDNNRFVTMGFRKGGGFVGEHDRTTGEPIPEHISARWQDVENLIDGLIETTNLLKSNGFHPVLLAANIAFGFVFIHPFSDGNGRIHRYLFHHLLASMKFTPQGIIFPVSAAILERIDDYKKVLENYSHPLLDFIEWRKTKDNNVVVLNDTLDYYRYFDATPLAEFLFECVDYTLNQIIPGEIDYLQRYDAMKSWLDDRFQMDDKRVALLMRFLEQNNGKLSKRARENEFLRLTDDEVREIELALKEL
jgi:hypothetical protein